MKKPHIVGLLSYIHGMNREDHIKRLEESVKRIIEVINLLADSVAEGYNEEEVDLLMDVIEGETKKGRTRVKDADIFLEGHNDPGLNNIPPERQN